MQDARCRLLKTFFSFRPNASVYLAFLFLTIGFSYPAILHLSTHVIGYQGDSWQYPLNLFLFRERVMEGKDPYYTDYLFHPPGTSLLLHNYTEVHDVVALVLHPFLNDLAISNLMILLSTFLTAVGTYRLAMELYGNRAGALFAAVAFAFCPNRMFRTLSQAHMALTQWLPFALWSFLKLAETRQWRYLWLTVLFSVLTCYTNYYYAVYLAIAFLLLLVYGLISSKEWRNPKFIGMLTATAVVSMIFLTPIGWRFWQDRQENAVSSNEDLDFAVQKSADLTDYLKIGPMNPYIKTALAGTFLQPRGINTSGWVVLFFSLAGIFFVFRNQQQRLKSLLFMGLVFLLLSLGPYLEVTLSGAKWLILLPDYLLMKVPVLNHVRFPARFSVMVTLPLALAAGYAVSLFVNRFSGNRKSVLVAVSFLFLLVELCPAPIPMKAFDPPAVFYTIAAEPYESMLTIPYFPGVGKYTDNMRYIMAHHKKIMEGKIARTPKAQSEYLSRIPLAHSLYAMTIGERLQENQAAADKQVSPFFQSFFDTHYLTVFPPFSTRKHVLAYVHEVFPDAPLLSSEKDIRVYRLNPARPAIHLNANDENIRLLLYENWNDTGAGAIAVSASPARMMLPYAKPSELLTFRIALKADAQGPITFMLNRSPLVQATLGKTPQTFTLDVPGPLLHSTGRVLTLQTSVPGMQLMSVDYEVTEGSSIR